MRKGKTSKKPRSAMTLWVLLIVVFMAELLVYSWCRVQYVHTGYEIIAARQKGDVLIALQDELKVEEAHLRSPERIRGIAEKRGLRIPDPGSVEALDTLAAKVEISRIVRYVQTVFPRAPSFRKGNM